MTVSSTTSQTHTFDKLPLDVIPNIFSYNNFVDQVHISKVCKAWHNVVLDPSLTYGKAFAVMRMAHVQPRISLLPPKHYHHFDLSNGSMLISFTKVGKIYIHTLFNPSSQMVIELDVRNIPGLTEKERDYLKLHSFTSAYAISPQSFCTVTSIGSIAFWKIIERQGVCFEKMFYPSNVGLEECTEDEKNSLDLNQMSSRLMGNKLISERRTTRFFSSRGHVTLNPPLNAVDLNTGQHSLIYSKLPFTFYNCKNNSNTLFHISQPSSDRYAYYLNTGQLNDANTFICTGQILLNDDGRDAMFSIAAANDTWIVVSRVCDNAFGEFVVSFELFDAATLQKIYTLHE